MGYARKRIHHTPEEYLYMERQAIERSQYIDGQIFAMAGESLEHSTLCCNLTALLVVQLKGKNCRAVPANMKIQSGAMRQGQHAGMFSYADASVVCGEPRFNDQHNDVLLNPTVIFEVLSPSTESFDRGDKFLRYRTHLETLSDYVLLSADKPLVEHFQRQAGGLWLYAGIEGLLANLELPSIGCCLPLAEIYDRVEWIDGE